ncbi:phosphoenolpyruvate--protein phosphotransferase [Aliiruegeria sabulilitoris]|uniref:phosphoenolpyruvate--protein phosphotransferase n=1 Tax=Aliiruegeria sabulilitoris TaxID=1510458 RepID=UPI00082F4038|nr:phosphoenolpyruvate--protein phosphotransferase [Aliiruegeria sabulilitoris]NDR55999.1 phosphoenolpyruvate--protein phosphotransferase [Pseudoruegeria sp. M32A2M]
MSETQSGSRKLLGRLKQALAEPAEGQERLDRITRLIAEEMATPVCSIYLFRDEDTLELCATEGLNPESVHKTRMRMGEGLVGRVAASTKPINTGNAPSEAGFRFMPETGEEIYSAFLGVPIQRLGERLGVLVVQSKESKPYSEDQVYATEVVAMVLAEMTELGAFIGEGAAMAAPHQHPVMMRGSVGQEGAAEGHVLLHEPRVVVTNPFADDAEAELVRLGEAVDKLRISVDEMLTSAEVTDKDQRDVLEAYRMFANSKGWKRRMEADINRGLSAEAAVEKEQTAARARMEQVPDPYLRERLHDLDDLSNRLLRLLTGQGSDTGVEMPENPVLVARNIGPGELLAYGRGLKGIILEEGSVGSHAAIVARALAIPLVINCERITTEALNGDQVLVDGEQGIVHLRPEDTVVTAFRDKMAMMTKAQERYASIRRVPATTVYGPTIRLDMNAGLMADLPSLKSSGAEGVGLFRTELQFLVRSKLPSRGELAATYSRVLDAAEGKRVVFRTLDIGSDKVLPYMKPQEEPNPALGWRAIRVGLDKPGVMRMQLQAMIRGAKGRPLSVMFPFVAQFDEFRVARRRFLDELDREEKMGHVLPSKVEIGAMLETPSLAFAPKQFFELADFISVGGNDLKQFFFAADRENERVRRRYDTLNVSFLTFLEWIVMRCNETKTPLSFCGEDAGRPVEALCFAAMGFRALSMRPASIGPVKHLLRRSNLAEVRELIDAARAGGAQTVRPALMDWLRQQG